MLDGNGCRRLTEPSSRIQIWWRASSNGVSLVMNCWAGYRAVTNPIVLFLGATNCEFASVWVLTSYAGHALPLQHQAEDTLKQRP